MDPKGEFAFIPFAAWTGIVAIGTYLVFKAYVDANPQKICPPGQCCITKPPLDQPEDLPEAIMIPVYYNVYYNNSMPVAAP